MDVEQTPSHPNADAIRAALDRLRSQPEFARSPRLAAFLDYIVTEALAGRGDALRAYTVATAVFDRDADFDAHSNSIVRVEATRLRKAIRGYYEGAGANDPVVIEVPLGGYQPVFSVRPAPLKAQAPMAEQGPSGTPELPVRESPPAREPLAAPDAGLPGDSVAPAPVLASIGARKAPRWALGGVGLAAALFAGFTLGSRQVEPVLSPAIGAVEKSYVARSSASAFNAPLPFVAVLPMDIVGHDIDVFGLAGQLQHDLADSIARFDQVRVLRGFSRIEGQGSAITADYELRGHFDAAAHGPYEATFRLLHTRDHRIVWSGAFNFSHFDIDGQARAALVRSIVTPIAQPFGAVASDLRARVEAGGATPRSAECLARYDDYWETRSEAKRRAAFDCVADAAQAHPKTSLFHVLLSNLYVAEYLGDLTRLGGQPSLEAAEQSALQAIRVAPGRAHSYLALSQVLNLKRDYEKAVRLAERAMEMNPLDTAIMAQLGSIYVLRGKLAHGGQLLRRAIDANPAYPGWIQFYLFLEAWIRDDKAAQFAALKEAGATEEPDVALARVVAAAEAGDLDEARRALGRLRASYPSIAAAPKAALERLTLAPDIIDRMMQSAQKVGL